MGPGEPYTPNSEKDTNCLGPVEPYAPSTHISELIVLAHIGKKGEPKGRPTTLAGPGSHLDMCAVMGIAIMPKGHNTCIWLRYGIVGFNVPLDTIIGHFGDDFTGQ